MCTVTILSCLLSSKQFFGQSNSCADMIFKGREWEIKSNQDKFSLIVVYWTRDYTLR